MINKPLGELAEIRVIYEAKLLDFDVSVPVGDNGCYDLVIGSKTLHRVQVKATDKYIPTPNGGRYSITAGFGATKKVYTKEHVDFILVYVKPCDAFYIIPVEELKTKTVAVYPHRDNPEGFYENYQDAWYLLD